MLFLFFTLLGMGTRYHAVQGNNVVVPVLSWQKLIKCAKNLGCSSSSAIERIKDGCLDYCIEFYIFSEAQLSNTIFSTFQLNTFNLDNTMNFKEGFLHLYTGHVVVTYKITKTYIVGMGKNTTLDLVILLYCIKVWFF